MSGEDLNFYDGYAANKRWDMGVATEDDRSFAALGVIGGFAPKSSILEVGFGGGGFMDWARSQGHAVTGVEILPDMLASAKSRGHRVFQGPLTAELLAGERFDVVVALDLIEHLTTEEIVGLFRTTRPMLNPGGRYLLRFPNGDSPFSRWHQHGDITHKTIIGSGMIHQLATFGGLEVVKIVNHRPMPAGLAAVRKALVYFGRNLIEVIVGLLYRGGRFPMDPNSVVVLKPRDG